MGSKRKPDAWPTSLGQTSVTRSVLVGVRDDLAAEKLTHVIAFPQSVPNAPKIPLPIPAKRTKRPKRWNRAGLFVVPKVVRS